VQCNERLNVVFEPPDNHGVRLDGSAVGDGIKKSLEIGVEGNGDTDRSCMSRSFSFFSQLINLSVG